MQIDAIRIATRESALALWQAEHVAAVLREHYPALQVSLLPMTTRGDQIQDRALATIGGKGLFLKELEVAMIEGRADIAVHSMKDVPMELDEAFAIAAILPRADPFDALVSNRYNALDQLPSGARVGTSSLRRQAQLRSLRPDLTAVDLRGNVNTRLSKLDLGQYDAIILACAGLDRLGLGTRIRERLMPPRWLPAVAQGAIGIECRAADPRVAELLKPLQHDETTRCVGAERAMNRRLHGSCQVPIAAFAQLVAGRIQLAGAVGSVADGRVIRAEASADQDDFNALGVAVAGMLLTAGAEEILAAHR